MSRRFAFIFSISLCFTAFASFGQNLNNNWKRDLGTSLDEFIQCADPKSPPCAGATGKALNTLYRVNDFYSNSSRRYMTNSEIAAYLRNSNDWTALGKPYDQNVLKTAQDLANAKKAVVAVYQNQQGIGHVAVITPGALQPSGSWGLNVPNAISFLGSDPQRSFIDKALSFAFAKNMMKDITIYGKSY